MSQTTVAGSFITANTIDGTKLALASQATGDIMYYNGTDWVRLGVGTDGQVLTVNNAENAPGWEAAGGGAVSAVANGSDNRIATFSSSDALNGEANFTFDNWPVVKRSAGTGDTFVMEGFNDANYHTRLVIRKSQHDTIDTMTVLDSDQTVGEISFQGASGTSAGNWGTGAAIRVNTSDNAWSGNACPAMMRLYTCPDGGSEPVQRMIIKANGHVGIGSHTTTTIDKLLHLYQGSAGGVAPRATAMLVIEDDTSDEISLQFLMPAGGTRQQTIFFGDNDENTRGGIIYDHGDDNMRFNTNGSTRLTINASGNFTGSSSNDISDERIKENIENTTVGLAEVMQLRPVKFNFKDGKGWGTPGQKFYGLIAQEVGAVIPEAMHIDESFDDEFDPNQLPDLKSVSMTQITTALIKAIQELKAEVDELKA